MPVCCLFPSLYFLECSFTFLGELCARLTAFLFTLSCLDSNILDSRIMTHQLPGLLSQRGLPTSRLSSNHHHHVPRSSPSPLHLQHLRLIYMYISLTTTQLVFTQPRPWVGHFRGTFSSILVSLISLSFSGLICQTPTLKNPHFVLSLILASLPSSALQLVPSVYLFVV